MGLVDKGKAQFQPYARLISVLGDQLISDKWVGVIELVKNCYDADAEKVNIRFLNFDNPSKDNVPTIEIEDDGLGMSKETVLDVWMKPATPNKLNKKKSKENEIRQTPKGRVMQGDKGVGRFAIYKLGDFVELHTKTKTTSEIKLTLDFHLYADDEFENNTHTDLFLDQIENEWEEHDTPISINNSKNQGTLIRIKDIRGTWKKDDLEKLHKAFFRMSPPKLPDVKVIDDFKTELFWENKLYDAKHKDFESLIKIAPYFFSGIIDGNANLDASFTRNDKTPIPYKFNLLDDKKEIVETDIKGIKGFKNQFFDKKGEEVIRRPTCGSFMFFFYAFNMNDPALGSDDKQFLKETSVYLYRDDVRVYPYGEIGDDWLNLSKSRGELKAGDYFSYNDLLGFIFITQDENAILRDAADREGLMNINGAKDDFVALIQAALKVMKIQVDIDRLKKKLEKDKVLRSFNEVFDDAYQSLYSKVIESDDKDLIAKSKRLFDATTNLVTKVKEDLKITQELAGTGMAIEKATHDTMSLLKRLKQNTEDFSRRYEKGQVDSRELTEFLREMEDDLEFLYQELQVLQPLFRVARKVTRDVSFKDVSTRVLKYFKRELENNISINLKGNDVVVRTNTGLILQVVLNLMDNSIFWLNQLNEPNKQITIQFNESDNQVIFADNGPGINDEIADIVFTEFYTKKTEGRGLGLYIVKELLDRIDAEISVITSNEDKILKGANFLIQFKKPS